MRWANRWERRATRSTEALARPNRRSTRTPARSSCSVDVRSALASRALVVRLATQRPVAWASSIASGTGISDSTVSRASIISIATKNESENSSVSHVSIVSSRTPTPSTSTSPTMRAIRSPSGVRCRSAMGQASTPRKASARTLARMRAFAVMSHHRLPIRGTSVRSVPPRSASAAQPTSAAPACPRSKASARSIARPSRIAGSTTAVFMTMPAAEPSTSCPATWRKYGRIAERNLNIAA